MGLTCLVFKGYYHNYIVYYKSKYRDHESSLQALEWNMHGESRYSKKLRVPSLLFLILFKTFPLTISHIRPIKKGELKRPPEKLRAVVSSVKPLERIMNLSQADDFNVLSFLSCPLWSTVTKKSGFNMPVLIVPWDKTSMASPPGYELNIDKLFDSDGENRNNIDYVFCDLGWHWAKSSTWLDFAMQLITSHMKHAIEVFCF